MLKNKELRPAQRLWENRLGDRKLTALAIAAKAKKINRLRRTRWGMDYRVGAIGWRLAARLGATLMVRVEIVKDDDANVYVATSDDLRGLVLEAESLDELRTEVLAAAPVLLELQMSASAKPRLNTELRVYDIAPCAA